MPRSATLLQSLDRMNAIDALYRGRRVPWNKRHAMGTTTDYYAQSGSASYQRRHVTGAHIRDAKLSEIGQLARIWFDGWQDAHARIVPAELARLRTLQSFDQRIRAASNGVRVAELAGAPVGFYFLKGAELSQFYVSSDARGRGIAAVMMADAEAHLGKRGVHTAWLACAIGNERAARFYEKCGWLRTGTVSDAVEVPGGTFALEVWRYEKSLR
jgi:GNAT superfamily N-acetyltransferase